MLTFHSPKDSEVYSNIMTASLSISSLKDHIDLALSLTSDLVNNLDSGTSSAIEAGRVQQTLKESLYRLEMARISTEVLLKEPKFNGKLP